MFTTHPATIDHRASALDRPLLIGSEIYRTSTYGSGHPLAIPRVSLCIDLCRALGWLPDAAYVDSPQAAPEQLARFHDPTYVAAVQRAEREQAATEADRRRFNIGANGNPVYGEMFRRPATACGASILAARLLAGGGIVHNPAGGTHHGRPGRASGFCYFNDPVLGILAMLDGRLHRVFYLDLDAHFGDGVQDAFHDDERVFTLSIHEAGRWPMARGDTETGPGGVRDRAGGHACNLPVPAGFNDSELEFLVETVVLPLIADFEPDALVIQGGCDGLADDPMSRLELSNRALWRAIGQVAATAPRLLVLGGGYHPWAAARCWAGVWAVLNGLEVPPVLPAAAQSVLRAVRWNHRRGRAPNEAWFSTLADTPRPGVVRDEVRALPARALAK